MMSEAYLRFREELAACAERGGSSGGELQAKIAAGHTALCPTNGGCLALDKAEDGAMVVWLGVGRRQSLMALEELVKDYARVNGCNRLRIEGRRGWARVLPHWTRRDEDDGTVTLELPI